MAQIEGFVYFDKNRTSLTASSVPIASVAIALQDINSGMFVAAQTDIDGSFRFEGVENATYNIVVAWGIAGAVPSPADFSNAVLSSPITSVTPPISVATNPQPNATHLDFLSQSTYTVTYSGSDISEVNFILGPVQYTPIDIIADGVVINPQNLISDADNGTFGSFAQGSHINRGADPEPYPGVIVDYEYILPDPVAFVPDDGQYGIQNTMTNNNSNTLNTWWRISDHSTGNETGRFLIVNGFDPGTVFFRTAVTVKSNSHYAFLGWFLNIYYAVGYSEPKFGIRISNPIGQIVYQASLGNDIPRQSDLPEWKQLGSIFNTGNNTNLTIEFLSEGPSTWGNDYCVDDLTLNEVIFSEIGLQIEKTASKDCVVYGQEVTFEFAIKNTSTRKLMAVNFIDELPPCLTFVEQSVKINGVSFEGYNPLIGFSIDLSINEEILISFESKAICYPIGGFVCNSAKLIYTNPVIRGESPTEYRVESNSVCIRIPQLYKDENGIWIAPTTPVEGGLSE